MRSTHGLIAADLRQRRRAAGGRGKVPHAMNVTIAWLDAVAKRPDLKRRRKRKAARAARRRNR